MSENKKIQVASDESYDVEKGWNGPEQSEILRHVGPRKP